MFKRLSHSKHITDYHFFIFYEFEIFEEYREVSFEEILEKFIRSYYFTDEFDMNQKQSFRESVAHCAFMINKIKVDDFRKIKARDLEKVVLSEIKKEGWEIADEIVKTDFKSNFTKSKRLLDYIEIAGDEMFYLDRDWFADTDKLIEVDYIYDYLLTFISINHTRTRLLLFDYGFD